MEHNLLQPLYETLKRLGNTEKVVSWRSKGWLTKKLTASTTTGNSFLRSVNQYGDSSFCLIFKGSYLKHKKAIFTPPNRINVVIIHKLDTWSQDLNSDFTLKDCLFLVLSQLNILIQINTYKVVMVLNSIHVQKFHYLTVAWVKKCHYFWS